MTLSYLVVTGSWLPKTRKRFSCHCKAIEYIKSVIDEARDDAKQKNDKPISEEEIHLSYRVLRIDDEKVSNFSKIFAGVK